MKNETFLARSATRWWSAPVRFTADAVAVVRRAAAAAERPRSAWLMQSPVGTRSALNAR